VRALLRAWAGSELYRSARYVPQSSLLQRAGFVWGKRLSLGAVFLK
jgi:hypothetical protein